jgi:thiamine transport system ATP-binding protein
MAMTEAAASLANTGLDVVLEGVRFSHGEWRVAYDLAVPAGAVVLVVGPSGAGKTTLLHLIAGFLVPQAGSIRIGGRDVTCALPHERPVTMIFQENNLFAHLDAFTNAGLGLDPRGRFDEGARRRILAALADVGLAGMERRLPRELSGGQRQRVALARALLRASPVMLLDEPLTALDPPLRREMVALLSRLHERHGMTMFIVSHEPAAALPLASHVAVIEAGRVAALGVPEALPEELRRRHGLDGPA